MPYLYLNLESELDVLGNILAIHFVSGAPHKHIIILLSPKESSTFGIIVFNLKMDSAAQISI
jgi:hypothetical protein